MPDPSPEPSTDSLRTRLNRFFAIIATLLIVFVALIGFLTVQVRATEELVTQQLFTAIRYGGASRAAVLNQETGLRGYLLTGEASFLDPYESGIPAEAEANARVRSVLGDEERLLSLFRDASAAAERWRVEYAEPAIAAVRAGGAAPLAPDATQRGETLFRAYRESYDTFTSELLDRREVAIDTFYRAQTAQAVTVALGVLAVAGAGLALGVALRRWVIRPLEDLAGQTRVVAEGNFRHRVTPTGPGEIAALARDVEAMRARIVADLSVVAEARGELEAANALLEAQTAELKRSNSDLEQFAYVASHDLQEPLRKVSSFTQLLQKRYGGKLDDRADQYIGFAVDGAKRMQVLINDLLAFSRVGRIGAGLGEVSLDECLDEALQSLTTATEENDARIERGSLPVVRGDKTLLTQVFQNLIGNSLKFRGDASPVVYVSSELRDDEWFISVSDNGIGIDPQFSDKVFVIFQRLHGRDEYEGTGIGLALCRKIIEYHGGRMWLEPRQDGDVGATFTFTLPVVANPNPTADVALNGGPRD
jgi:signal transduction histidine kinase